MAAPGVQPTGTRRPPRPPRRPEHPRRLPTPVPRWCSGSRRHPLGVGDLAGALAGHASGETARCAATGGHADGPRRHPRPRRSPQPAPAPTPLERWFVAQMVVGLGLTTSAAPLPARPPVAAPTARRRAATATGPRRRPTLAPASGHRWRRHPFRLVLAGSAALRGIQFSATSLPASPARDRADDAADDGADRAPDGLPTTAPVAAPADGAGSRPHGSSPVRQ